MPILLLLSIIGTGAFFGSIVNNATEPSPVLTTPQDQIFGNISPLTVGVYGATALGLYFLYKKVRAA